MRLKSIIMPQDQQESEEHQIPDVHPAQWAVGNNAGDRRTAEGTGQEGERQQRDIAKGDLVPPPSILENARNASRWKQGGEGQGLGAVLAESEDDDEGWNKYPSRGDAKESRDEPTERTDAESFQELYTDQDMLTWDPHI